MNMKISLLNPNSSQAVSTTMAHAGAEVALDMARDLFGDSTQISSSNQQFNVEIATLEAAPLGIESDADIALVTPMVVRFVTETPADAYVIGCFSDPGVRLSRTVTSKPVIGIGEAAYRQASDHSRPFGVVSLSPASVERHRAAIETFGLSHLLVDDLPIHMSVADSHASDAAIDAISEIGHVLVEKGAKALVLACAGMAHHCEQLQAKIGCPIIDPVQAGVRAAIFQLAHVDYPKLRTVQGDRGV